MDLDDQTDTAIDPETRAFVFSLVSALGGPSASDDGRYVLGDDALAVLKDIKRWMRVYDNQLNSLVVSRLLAEANFVKGDLLEILAQWPEDAVEGSLRSKLALTCVDLLTQLTWPAERADNNSMKIEHFFHMPFIQAAQASYKRAILHHNDAQILRQIVRAGLPPMAQTQKERSPTEDMIIRVVLFAFRNIAMIEKAPGVHAEESNEEIGRSATIDAFHKQDVFSLLLTVGSGISDEYASHDVELLDILFHLLKGVEPQSLFLEKEEIISAQTKELKDLIGKEKNLLAGYQKYAPSRHNRFVPMMWMQREDGKRTTVVGQKAYASDQIAIDEMDRSKKFKKPRRGRRGVPEKSEIVFDAKTPLTQSARRRLKTFVEQFIDSSFNPLFLSVRRAIEREAERVANSPKHKSQFFYLVSWFLQAECARRRKQMDQKEQPDVQQSIAESFGLVANVLNQETFALLQRSMQVSQDDKSWRDLNAQMRCLSQILITVHEMTDSAQEEDQEIAENILSRIFYEQSTHDRVISLLRSYNDQGFGYLDACTELAHTFLRVLERYSKTNVDMQVRRIRRVRKRKKDEEATGAAESHEEENAATKQMDLQEAQRVSSERKFDFARYAARFVNQASVDTFAALLRYYQDLSHDQLKRTHRFLHRVAFKMEMEVYLFRMDIIMLLQRLVKGPNNLDKDNDMYKEWEELTRHVFRKFIKKMEDRPVLGIEVLFSKMPNTMFYLQHGYDRDLPKRIVRAPAELEVKGDMEREEQIGVVVSALVNQSKSDHLAWVKSVLAAAVEERNGWAAANAARQSVEHRNEQPDGDNTEALQDSVAPSEEQEATPITVSYSSDDQRTAGQRDKHLRLLLNLLGFTYQDFLEDDPPQTVWTIPGNLSTAQLQASHDTIAKTEFSPPSFDDGKNAEDFLRNKVKSLATSNPRHQAGNNDEFGSDDESNSGSELFVVDANPDARPTDVDPSIRTTKPNKKRTGRSRHTRDEMLDDRGLEERRLARKKLEAERAQKIKSQLYVSKSDDESDEERDRAFFAMEARLRRETGDKVVRAAEAARVIQREEMQDSGSTRRKRKSAVIEDDDKDDSSVAGTSPAPVKRSRGLATLMESDSDGDDDAAKLFEADADIDGNVQSSPGRSQSQRSRAASVLSLASSSASGTPSALPTRHDEPQHSEDDSDKDSDTPPSSERPSLRRRGLDNNQTRQPSRPHADPGDHNGDSHMSSDDSDKENAGAARGDAHRREKPRRRGLKVIADEEEDEDDGNEQDD